MSLSKTLLPGNISDAGYEQLRTRRASRERSYFRGGFIVEGDLSTKEAKTTQNTKNQLNYEMPLLFYALFIPQCFLVFCSTFLLRRFVSFELRTK